MTDDALTSDRRAGTAIARGFLRRAPIYFGMAVAISIGLWAADHVAGWALFVSVPVFVLGFSHLIRLAGAEPFPKDTPLLFHAKTLGWAVAWAGSVVIAATGSIDGVLLPSFLGATSTLYALALLAAHRRRASGAPDLGRQLPSAFGRILIAHPVAAGAIALGLVLAVVLLAPEPPRGGVNTWWVVGLAAVMVYGAATAWFLPRIMHRPAAQVLELSVVLALVPLWLGFTLSLSGASSEVLYAGAALSGALIVGLLARAAIARADA